MHFREALNTDYIFLKNKILGEIGETHYADPVEAFFIQTNSKTCIESSAFIK